jgi:ADP-heptose:LPS heptosyltransferase
MLGRQYLRATWYPSALIVGLALLDQARRVFARPVAPVPLPDLARATIAIAKPDHLGDLVQATALFRALRDRLPDARLILVHGSWAKGIASWLQREGYVHELVTYDAAWLQPPGTRWWTRLRVQRDTRARAAAALRASGAAVYLDIRCTSPGTLDLAIASGIPVRIGFGLRGRSWDYHQLIRYDEDESLGQNWLHAMEALGLPATTYRGPVLPQMPAPASDAPVVIQPGSRTEAKEAPAELWKHLISGLARRGPILLVGNAADRERFAFLLDHAPEGRCVNAMGETTFPELLALVARARAAVGVESLVAHLAVGYARPTVVLSNPKASGVVAFPDALPSLTFVDMTHDPQHAAQLSLAHIDRCLA